MDSEALYTMKSCSCLASVLQKYVILESFLRADVSLARISRDHAMIN